MAIELRRLLVFGLLLLSGAAQAGAPTPFAPDGAARILLRHVTLIDVAAGVDRPDMDVLVAGERIAAIIPDAQLDPHLSAGARTIDLSGRFLMPGLIDAHVHLATPPNRRQAEVVLRRDLYGGVTAVRDMADDLRPVGDLARAARVGEIAAPDIFYAALMGGPGLFSDPRTAQTSTGFVNGTAPWMQQVTNATDPVTAVTLARGTGATAIKLYGDLTPALAARLAAEAHRQHLLVWAHATLYPARPSEVLAAGADALSHACLFVREPDAHVPGYAEPHRPPNLAAVRGGDNPALAVLFKEMARRGTILDATLWAYSNDQPVSTTTPPFPPGSCDDVVGGAIARQAFRAGVPIDAGTDNVGDWTDPWPDLFHELAKLQARAGMSPVEILRSATLVSARAAGQDKNMGSIEPGKLANLVVLRRNPLADLGNLKTIERVIKRGVVLERSIYVPPVAGDITDH